jgi:hypothetical protein
LVVAAAAARLLVNQSGIMALHERTLNGSGHEL